MYGGEVYDSASPTRVRRHAGHVAHGR
jgi:hypothetical protein